ncbi:MAG: helix-turn-helix domain-containing protein, partial [Bacteroides sp.]|uniref:PucR family transcriptional regulator n=1 Tax=Bacteroides sp. TaxID=29523 RepID=UPI002FCC1244
VIEVPAHEPNRYYLIIHTGNHMLSRIDTMTIENFASLLQMETLKQNALEQQLFLQHNNTTLDLLLSRYSSHEKIDNALKNLGIDTSPLYQVLLIHIRTLHSEDEHRKCDILAAIKQSVRSQYSNLAYFMSNDRIVFLHNHENELSQFKKTLVQSLLSTLHSDSTLPAFTHISAISDSTDRYSIGSINKEVLNIYQIFSSTSLKNHCMRYSDLGCLRVFLNVEDYASLRETIDPRILKLYDENPEQFTTLVALCESNLHYQDTAKQLFLHPKTVRYRIDQIESTYDLSVHDPDDFLQILLAGKIIILTETAV